MVRDEQGEAVVEAIRDGSRTGEVGDGKIFLTRIDEVIRRLLINSATPGSLRVPRSLAAPSGSGYPLPEGAYRVAVPKSGMRYTPRVGSVLARTSTPRCGPERLGENRTTTFARPRGGITVVPPPEITSNGPSTRPSSPKGPETVSVSGADPPFPSHRV